MNALKMNGIRLFVAGDPWRYFTLQSSLATCRLATSEQVRHPIGCENASMLILFEGRVLVLEDGLFALDRCICQGSDDVEILLSPACPLLRSQPVPTLKIETV